MSKIQNIGAQILSNSIETSLKAIQDQNKAVDVLVIGSGTAGVTTAVALAEKRPDLRIVILEAGPLSLLEHIGSCSVRFNARAVQGIQDQITYKTSWITEKEYQELKGQTFPTPNTKGWSAVGGRTLLWGGFAPRFLPGEFNDWPFTYEEFERYYQEAEDLISVSPRPLKAPPFVTSKSQEKFAAELKNIGFFAKESPIAIDTAHPVNGHIPRGFDSSVARLVGCRHLVKFGHQPGVSLVSQAEVVALEKKSSLINAVHVTDKRTGLNYTLCPKHVVLACGGIQSVRLVMLSKIEDNREVLGHYINDHIFARGHLKLRKGQWDDLMYLYCPPTERGLFHLQLSGPLTEQRVEALRKDWVALPTSWLLWKEPGNCLQFQCFGYSTMEKNNRLVINHQHDAVHGKLPGCAVIYDRSGQDLAVIQAMRSAIEHMANSIDGEILNWEVLSPGTALHDIGGLRMGNNSDTSIVNPSGQFWRINNLSVADASAWPSQGIANPYLTITAWSLKHAEDLVRSFSLNSR